MPQIQPDRNKKKLVKWIAPIIAAAVMALALFLWLNRDNPVTAKNDSIFQLEGKSMNETEVARDLEIAASAAVTAKPVTGAVTQRPDFVSELEWQILRNAAGQRSEDSGKELSDLVNKLLFAKKKEAWLTASTDTATRHDLAKQLLEMIPLQVQLQALDPAAAKKLEGELRADLGTTAH